MSGSDERTMQFDWRKSGHEPREVLLQVHRALEDKGYDAVGQMVGYLLSGDPTYITSHMGARNLVRTVDRDELLEELLERYLHRDQAPPTPDK